MTSPAGGSRPGPDFFVVGQMKAGTTALYEMLREHPDVFLPDLKEPAFFATDLQLHRQLPVGDVLPGSLEEYLELFDAAGPDQTCGEASAAYLLSTEAAAGIAGFNPDARIIAILREPASYLRSVHLQLVEHRTENVRDLRRALALEPARREGRKLPRGSYRPQLLQYSEHVRYVDQLERYTRRFPDEQMLVLVYDDFREDNPGTLREIFAFLGVDPEVAVGRSEANRTVATRSWMLHEALQRLSVGQGPLSKAVKRAVKAVLGQQTRRRLLDTLQRTLVFRRPPPPDPELMTALRRRFKPEVERLSVFLDRDLITEWGYAEL